ncbi:MAG: PD-(D/E)XK nuclease family protein [Marinilabiliales bacterium]|nr:PD-(D/E)XK nuclease family protein [Marinilabiliales bacterium]
MRFYYKYVCDIPEEEKLEKDIDQRRFGNILHDTLQKLYEPCKGNKKHWLRDKDHVRRQ